MSFVRFEEQAEPATPPAGKATLYVDSADKEVAVKKDDGSVQKFLTSAIITEEYVSPQQTITSGGLLTLNHGLAGIPKFVTYELVCIAAEHGYSIGDVIEPADISKNQDDSGHTVKKTATQLQLRFGSRVNPYQVNDFTTGTRAALTNANWEIVIKAYA